MTMFGAEPIFCLPWSPVPLGEKHQNNWYWSYLNTFRGILILVCPRFDNYIRWILKIEAIRRSTCVAPHHYKPLLRQAKLTKQTPQESAVNNNLKQHELEDPVENRRRTKCLTGTHRIFICVTEWTPEWSVAYWLAPWSFGHHRARQSADLTTTKISQTNSHAFSFE